MRPSHVILWYAVMSNCMWLTVHVRFRWVISQKPTWQAVFAYFLPSWRWFCFFHTSHKTVRQNKQNLSLPPRGYINLYQHALPRIRRWGDNSLYVHTCGRRTGLKPSHRATISTFRNVILELFCIASKQFGFSRGKHEGRWDGIQRPVSTWRHLPSH